MISFLIATVSLTVLIAALVLLNMQHIPNWKRIASVVLLSGFVATSFFVYSDMLGRPKPTRLSLMSGEGKVIASSVREGQGIYLWVQPKGPTEPRYFVLPWDSKTAEELHEAQKKAGQGGNVIMRFPEKFSWEHREPLFYPLPQPALPPKNGGDQQNGA